MIKQIIIIYGIIMIINFICEYISISKRCEKTINFRENCIYKEKPKFDYVFFRSLAFPITWIRKIIKYTK